jgi:menaquinone-dependent protoporphyrinogen oxidase
MNKKVLIAYASKCGSTAEVADAIAQELTLRGLPVAVRLAQNVPHLEGYQSVIVGSAIRMGQWLPEAVEFVETHQHALRRLPTAFFTVHMLNTGDDAESIKNRLCYLDAVRKLVAPQQEVFFAGKIELAKMSFVDRLISITQKAQDADLRDWSRIREWGQTVFA